jgi:hypothetical protein
MIGSAAGFLGTLGCFLGDISVVGILNRENTTKHLKQQQIPESLSENSYQEGKISGGIMKIVFF